MVETVHQHVKSVSFELRRELRDSDVTYLNAHGEIQEPHTVQISKGEGLLDRSVW